VQKSKIIDIHLVIKSTNHQKAMDTKNIFIMRTSSEKRLFRYDVKINNFEMCHFSINVAHQSSALSVRLATSHLL